MKCLSLHFVQFMWNSISTHTVRELSIFSSAVEWVRKKKVKKRERNLPRYNDSDLSEWSLHCSYRRLCTNAAQVARISLQAILAVSDYCIDKYTPIMHLAQVAIIYLGVLREFVIWVVLYTLISVFYRLVLCQNENFAELKNTFDQAGVQFTVLNSPKHIS